MNTFEPPAFVRCCCAHCRGAVVSFAEFIKHLRHAKRAAN